jgi:hypothetical protein
MRGADAGGTSRARSASRTTTARRMDMRDRSAVTEAGLVRHVSGDWDPSHRHVRLRIEADNLDRPQDVSIALGDVEALIVLLLMLSNRAGAGTLGDHGSEHRPALPLPLDSISLGETEERDVVLQLDVGRTTLTFLLPGGVTRKLGESLLTLSASSADEPAN